MCISVPFEEAVDKCKESVANLEKHILDKVFKNGLSQICGRQPLKNLNGYGLLK